MATPMDGEGRWHTGTNFVGEYSLFPSDNTIQHSNPFHLHFQGVGQSLGTSDRAPVEHYQTTNRASVEDYQMMNLASLEGYHDAHPEHRDFSLFSHRGYASPLQLPVYPPYHAPQRPAHPSRLSHVTQEYQLFPSPPPQSPPPQEYQLFPSPTPPPPREQSDHYAAYRQRNVRAHDPLATHFSRMSMMYRPGAGSSSHGVRSARDEDEAGELIPASLEPKVQRQIWAGKSFRIFAWRYYCAIEKENWKRLKELAEMWADSTELPKGFSTKGDLMQSLLDHLTEKKSSLARKMCEFMEAYIKANKKPEAHQS